MRVGWRWRLAGVGAVLAAVAAAGCGSAEYERVMKQRRALAKEGHTRNQFLGSPFSDTRRMVCVRPPLGCSSLRPAPAGMLAAFEGRRYDGKASLAMYVFSEEGKEVGSIDRLLGRIANAIVQAPSVQQFSRGPSGEKTVVTSNLGGKLRKRTFTAYSGVGTMATWKPADGTDYGSAIPDAVKRTAQRGAGPAKFQVYVIEEEKKRRLALVYGFDPGDTDAPTTIQYSLEASWLGADAQAAMSQGAPRRGKTDGGKGPSAPPPGDAGIQM